jgi:hypothetical protein
MAVAEEISKYKLDLVGMQEIKRDRGATDPAGEFRVVRSQANIHVSVERGMGIVN